MSEGRGSLGTGVLISVGLTAGGMVLIGAFGGWLLLIGIGVVQLLWMLPAWLIYRGQGQAETAKGILIAAGVVFLLNAACWGLVSGIQIGR